MTNQTYQPVEPHWPLGRVGQFYLKKVDAGHEICIRELVVLEADRTESGWLVTAGVPGRMYSIDDLVFEFEVDQDGESTDCVPWDDELDREFGDPLRSQPNYTVAEGERPIRVGEPMGTVSDDEIKRFLESPKTTVSQRKGES